MGGCPRTFYSTGGLRTCPRHRRLLKLHAIYNPPLHLIAFLYSQLTPWYCFSKRVLRMKSIAFFVYGGCGLKRLALLSAVNFWVLIGQHFSFRFLARKRDSSFRDCGPCEFRNLICIISGTAAQFDTRLYISKTHSHTRHHSRGRHQ